MVTMFSVYCERRFEVEPVEVIYPDGKSYLCPELSPKHLEVPLSYINNIAGLSLEADKVAGLLNKMQLKAAQSVSEGNECMFTVSVPPTRSDVLHACDVAEVMRSSLMAGISKIAAQNKDHPKPIKIFEVGDVVVLDESKDVGATNHRQLAALYCGATSGFELIHGLVDRIMEVTGAPFVLHGDNTGYRIEPSDESGFLSGRQASIIYNGKKKTGTFGVVHPQVKGSEQ